jgi:glycosyltransferase involved in cell wall biosynthesis
VKFLFVKDRLAWPRASGHDILSYEMMKALASLGHEVSLATAEPASTEAVAGLPLTHQLVLGDGPADDPRVRLSKLQERFRSYWGISRQRIGSVRDAADTAGADAVVVSGLNVLPYLGAIDGPARVWYAADEWVWHHASQIRPLEPPSWSNLREAAVKGMYEWAYRGLVDRAWVVSEADRRAMAAIFGRGKVDVVITGVDGDHFRPLDVEQRERSCVFWGRLDFGPNIQAIEWFCKRAWPAIRRQTPDARFTIYGFNPTSRIMALGGVDGIEVVADLPDIRLEIARHQVVVLPFVSGGGIKNKLLEAASMAKAIVCSPVAVNGLRGPGQTPLMVARSAEDWAEALGRLWGDPDRRRELGDQARRRVLEHQTWEAAAKAVASRLAGPLEDEGPQ